jgi:hypothetical protein
VNVRHIAMTRSRKVRGLRLEVTPLGAAAVLLPVLTQSMPFLTLAFERWTSCACPSCEAAPRRDFCPANVRFGNSIVDCKKCGVSFDDGPREWPQQEAAPEEVPNVPSVLLISFSLLSHVLFWSLLRHFFVHRSIHRFQESTTPTASSNIHT